MKSCKTGLSSACLGTMLVVSSSGCNSIEGQGNRTSPDDPKIVVVEQPLAAYTLDPNSLWTSPISVCFTKHPRTTYDACQRCKAAIDAGRYCAAADWNVCIAPNPPVSGPQTCTNTSNEYKKMAGEELLTPTDAQYARLQTLGMTALQESWGLVPGLSFVNHGECPASAANYLKIELSWHTGGGGECGIGKGAQCSVIGSDADPHQIDLYKETIAHEVGHGLGAAHEHQRNGVSNCKTNIYWGCKRCVDAIDAGGACAAADWNACFWPSANVTTPQTPAKTSADYKLMCGFRDNTVPIDSLDLLTVYDTYSIMNYCAFDVDGRSKEDYHPTALDLLGMEMTYPIVRDYPIGCSSGCFRSAAGVITRTDGYITTDWTARGGLNVLLNSPGTGAQVASLATSTLTPGTSNLSFSFFLNLDPRKNTKFTTKGVLVNSNAQHTAVLASLLTL